MGFDPSIVGQKRAKRKADRQRQIAAIRSWMCPPCPGAIVLPYPPSGNHFYTVARGRKILSDVGRAYKDKVVESAKCQGAHIFTGNVSVTLDVYRPRKSGDLDNTQKGLLDSLSGIAWHDDDQIVHIEARRHDDKFYPRVEVRIRSVA